MRSRAVLNVASTILGVFLLQLLFLALPRGRLDAQGADDARVQHGRYLVKITGCNDCHTANYTERAGHVADGQWLEGNRLGFRGPWGTTYASNLRLTISQMSEAQWVQMAHSDVARPPMPSFTLHAMTSRDLEDIYRFVRRLGPAGITAPAYLPPNQSPPAPYVSYPGIKS